MARHNLEERHVVVTGASSGLGRAMALELASRGARVGLLARRAEMLEELVGELEGLGADAAYVAVDVVDTAAMAEAVKTLERTLGPVYGVIANAGIDGNTRNGMLLPEKANRCIDVNVKGVVNTIAAVQEGLRERNEGFISTVSSLAAYRGLPSSGPYSASKAAVSTLMESLRVDLRRTGITTTTIHPGFVRTPLTAKAKHSQPFLMDADRAARIMVKGLERGRTEINYPWQMACLMAVVRRMPNFVYDWVMGKAGN